MVFKDIPDVPIPLPPTYEEFISPIFVKKPYMILLSFNPQWLEPIKLGKKMYEFRNRIGKLWNPGLTVLLYITKNHGGSGKIEYSFTIDEIYKTKEFVKCNSDNTKIPMVSLIPSLEFPPHEYKRSDLSKLGYNYQKYAIEIKDFKKLHKPLELGAFKVNKAPQSWQYLFEGRNY